MEQQALLSTGRIVSPELLATALQGRQQGTRLIRSSAFPRGDHDLNPDLYCSGSGAREAAVLVPLIRRSHGPQVVLTRRSARLSNHAGQIAFPGGCREPNDRDLIATALRETEEEIGLAPQRVQTLGELDLYVTRTGFAVTPIVGWIEEDIPLNELVVDPEEVDEVFEVPLPYFLNPLNREQHSRWEGDKKRQFYVYPYRNYYIWGATAGMLNNLVEVLTEEC
jgi:8-oxo-dGTP pyrophosphatase MutT (NUDIX family)